jgi:protein-tyrosine phosphatase
MIRVLFVCLGNICRSPMAEGLLKKRIKDLGLENQIHVESRATSSYEIGNPPHRKTMAILNRENAKLIGKTAQLISTEDFNTFDYIIGMDLENIDNLKRIAGRYQDKIYLFRDIDESNKNEEVLDPYYNGQYEETYKLINDSLDKWINHLIKTKNSY